MTRLLLWFDIRFDFGNGYPCCNTLCVYIYLYFRFRSSLISVSSLPLCHYRIAFHRFSLPFFPPLCFPLFFPTFLSSFSVFIIFRACTYRTECVSLSNTSAGSSVFLLDLGGKEAKMDTISTEQYTEEAIAENDYNREEISPLEKSKSVPNTSVDSNESPCSGFDCNICLDSVQDPVVTLCGHLYCWPCIYKWLHFQTISTEYEDVQPQQQCPVCKAEVSEGTLVPLFGRGQTTKPSKGKAPKLGIIIPRRPLGLACGFDSPRSPFPTSSLRPSQQMRYRNYSPHQSPLYDYSPSASYSASPLLAPRVTAANMFDPVIGMFGEMIYARVFGNSLTNIYNYPNSYNLAGSTTPRLRRHVMQADKSLSRICFFLFCCVFLCFLSF